jgi:hypothetical protein
MSLVRCKTCVMPNTRPDTPFVDGECQACRNYKRRPEIDWAERKSQLVQLLDRHDGRVLVPSSGGKDSTWQVLTLLELGADVTIVTARTCHLTAIGRANIDNLSRYARTIEVVPNMTVRAKLNRLGLEMVGDISWPEHCAIFSAPFQVAAQTGHKLLMYGECPQQEYGGPTGSEQAMQLTKRWRSEFGGFLGLRPDDFVGIEGITERDMQDYKLPDDMEGIEAHFLGQYLPWDSRRNAEVAQKAGMQMLGKPPCTANWWYAENVDSAQTGLHDFFMFAKYAFGRGCQQISVDVRSGLIDREMALLWVQEFDGLFPQEYMGVLASDALDRIGVSRTAFTEAVNRFKNVELLGGWGGRTLTEEFPWDDD